MSQFYIEALSDQSLYVHKMYQYFTQVSISRYHCDCAIPILLLFILLLSYCPLLRVPAPIVRLIKDYLILSYAY